MSLTAPQQLWLARFTGGKAELPDPLTVNDQLKVILASQELEAANLRHLHLEKMRRDVDSLKQRYRDNFHQDIELLTGKKMAMINPDQTLAFDWIEDSSKVDMQRLIESKRDQRMSEVTVELFQIEQRLSEQEFVWSKLNADKSGIERTERKRLFERSEIISELYTPLVREQIIPEDFVPDDFSEVQHMIDASNDYYMQELEQIEESAETKGNLELAGTVFKSVASIAVESVGLTGLDKQKKELITESLKFVSTAVSTGVEVAECWLDKDPHKGCQTLLAKMAKSTKKMVQLISGNDELGEYVEIAMKATGHIDKLIQCFREEERDIDEILETLVEIVADGIEFRGVNAEEETKELLERSKAATVVACNSALAAKKAHLIQAITAEKTDWGSICTAVVTSCGEAVKEGFALKFPEENEEVDEDLETLVEGVVALTESLSGSDAVAAIDVAAAESDEELGDSASQFIEEERRQFEDSLAMLGQKDVLDRSEIASISTMIAKMKRDALILSTVKSIGEAGGEVAKAFFEPMEIAGTIVGFIAELSAAINRARAMRTWMESRSEALQVSSPYLTSIQNFVTNQQEQFAHHTIAASVKALRIAAQIAKNTPVVAVATVIDKGLAIAESLQDIIYAVANRIKLEKAWKQTQYALQHPENRKANLIARRMNPTLAKYSIAYGAIEARDPIAISALNSIGLSREVLMQKDASVGKVTEYLERLYSEDIKVKKRYIPATAWARNLPEPSLKPRSWMLAVRHASSEGPLDNGRNNRILAELQRTQMLSEAFDRDHVAGNHTKEQTLRFLDQLQELIDELTTYIPKDADASPVPDMVNFQKQILALADQKLIFIEGVARDLGHVLDESSEL